MHTDSLSLEFATPVPFAYIYKFLSTGNDPDSKIAYRTTRDLPGR